MSNSPPTTLMPKHTAALDYIGWEILTAWQEAHGALIGTVACDWEPQRIIIRLNDVFSLAEINLGQHPQGHVLLEQYVRELLSEICRQYTTAVRQLAHHTVAKTTIHVDPAANLILCVFVLEQPIKYEG